jgi:excisionase family DNA binding protein
MVKVHFLNLKIIFLVLKSTNILVNKKRKEAFIMEVIKIEKVVLHVSEVASLMQCSSLTVYKLIHSGKLSAYKSGQAWKIQVSDLEKYLRSIKPYKSSN